jgi:hypothetical protein
LRKNLFDLYFAHSVTDVIKSRKIKLTIHIALVLEIGACTEVQPENLRESDYLEDLIVEGRIMLTLVWVD